MASNKLTDRQIAELYFGLVRHYKDCVGRGMSPPQIYNALTNEIHHTLNSANSPLHYLDQSEKQKIYNILNTFFYATPQYRDVPPQYQGQNFFNDGTKPPKVIITHYDYRTSYYQNHNDFLFNWLLIRQLTARPYYNNYPRPNTHSHPVPGNNDRKNNEALPFLLLLLLAAVVAACALIAFYYMLNQTCDSFERFLCNEGWMQATISLLSMAVTTTASTLLASAFVSSGLFSLAVAAGVANPFAWVTFGVVGLGAIGGALSHLVCEQVQSYIIKQSNPNALDPQDPSRFTLTEAEALTLEKIGSDPIKVKCAIVALRAELGDKSTPSFLSRLFINKNEQEILSKVRGLRSGKLVNVAVGDMIFDCRFGALSYIRAPNPFEEPSPSVYGQTQPSAPPAYEEDEEEYKQYRYDNLSMDKPPAYS